MAAIRSVGGFDSLGDYRVTAKGVNVNGLEIFLKFLNLLIIPAFFYIVRLEKRLSKIETILDLCLQNKVSLSEK